MLKVLPGRLAVLWPVQQESLIIVPDEERRRIEEMYGTAIETRVCEVVSSGLSGLQKGDLTPIRCDAAGLELSPDDYPFVPKGFEIRIYGVTEPVLGYGEHEDDIAFGVVTHARNLAMA